MTDRTQEVLPFPRSARRAVEASFSGGHITSDGGLLLLLQADRHLDLLRRLSLLLPDDRRQASVQHSLLSLLRQRVYGLACGYEDQSDHDELRHDLLMQTAVGRDEVLGHSTTLNRLENRATKAWAWRVHELLVDTFIARHRTPPTELILDADATDDPTHGEQEGRFFHGYYGHYCFLPLYVFCGDFPLVAYLRASNEDGARHAWAALALLIERLRQAWPAVRITVRGDSGFCRWKLMRWCDRHGVDYVLGLARNRRLEAMAGGWLDEAEAISLETSRSARLYREVEYAAKTWDRPRRVVVKAEYLRLSSTKRNPRFVVTSLEDPPEQLYRDVYCARGDMENRIKEQQLGLFADRTSAHRWWSNQLRLLLSTLAYVLINEVRAVGLKGTKMARAQAWTIRLKLLKVGAVVVRNTRRVRVLLSSSYPHQELWWLAARKLAG